MRSAFAGVTSAFGSAGGTQNQRSASPSPSQPSGGAGAADASGRAPSIVRGSKGDIPLAALEGDLGAAASTNALSHDAIRHWLHNAQPGQPLTVVFGEHRSEWYGVIGSRLVNKRGGDAGALVYWRTDNRGFREWFTSKEVGGVIPDDCQFVSFRFPYEKTEYFFCHAYPIIAGDDAPGVRDSSYITAEEHLSAQIARLESSLTSKQMRPFGGAAAPAAAAAAAAAPAAAASVFATPVTQLAGMQAAAQKRQQTLQFAQSDDVDEIVAAAAAQQQQQRAAVAVRNAGLNDDDAAAPVMDMEPLLHDARTWFALTSEADRRSFVHEFASKYGLDISVDAPM